MEKLNRYQVSTTEETQEHVLTECTGIHNNQESKVQLQEIFDENTELKGKAGKIDHIMTRLTKSGVLLKKGNTTR